MRPPSDRTRSRWRQSSATPGTHVDPIEAYTPGASRLTYNAATGIWHYNWQTPKHLEGHCVKMTLNLTDDYALFKFIK